MTRFSTSIEPRAFCASSSCSRCSTRACSSSCSRAAMEEPRNEAPRRSCLRTEPRPSLERSSRAPMKVPMAHPTNRSRALVSTVACALAISACDPAVTNQDSGIDAALGDTGPTENDTGRPDAATVPDAGASTDTPVAADTGAPDTGVTPADSGLDAVTLDPMRRSAMPAGTQATMAAVTQARRPRSSCSSFTPPMARRRPPRPTTFRGSHRSSMGSATPIRRTRSRSRRATTGSPARGSTRPRTRPSRCCSAKKGPREPTSRR